MCRLEVLASLLLVSCSGPSLDSTCGGVTARSLLAAAPRHSTGTTSSTGVTFSLDVAYSQGAVQCVQDFTGTMTPAIDVDVSFSTSDARFAEKTVRGTLKGTPTTAEVTFKIPSDRIAGTYRPTITGYTTTGITLVASFTSMQPTGYVDQFGESTGGGASQLVLSF